MVAQKVDHNMDLRGKVCPYPTVETPVFLKKMAADELLEVLTGYYLFRQTIPAVTGDMEYPCQLIGGEKLDRDSILPFQVITVLNSEFTLSYFNHEII